MRISKLLALLLRLAIGSIVLAFAYFGWTLFFSENEKTQFISSDKPYTSIDQILQDERFNGKLVYGDFWGTSCMPCIEEFREYTQPLKNYYKGRNDIVFLYLCVDNNLGAEYRWKKRIVDNNVQGYHVLLNQEQFDRLYDQVADQKDAVKYIPRYFIRDKRGHLVVRQAKRPSDEKILYRQIDSTLAMP